MKKKFIKEAQPGIFLIKQAAKLWALLPKETPEIQPLVPLTSKNYMKNLVKKIGYHSNSYSLFCLICNQFDPGSADFEHRVLKALDCYQNKYKKILRRTMSDKALKQKAQRIAPPLCPFCQKTLMVIDLKRWPANKNTKRFQSLWICIECSFELFSYVQVDRFGFPEKTIIILPDQIKKIGG